MEHTKIPINYINAQRLILLVLSGLAGITFEPSKASFKLAQPLVIAFVSQEQRFNRYLFEGNQGRSRIA